MLCARTNNRHDQHTRSWPGWVVDAVREVLLKGLGITRLPDLQILAILRFSVEAEHVGTQTRKTPPGAH